MKTQKVVALSGMSLLLNACMNQYTIRTLPSPQTVDGRVGSPLVSAQPSSTPPTTVVPQTVPVQTIPKQPSTPQTVATIPQAQVKPVEPRPVVVAKPAPVQAPKPILTPAVTHNTAPIKRTHYDLSHDEMNDLELKIMRRHVNMKKANQTNQANQAVVATSAKPKTNPVYRHHKKESFVCQNGLEIITQPSTKDKNTILLSAPNAKQKAVAMRLIGGRFISKNALFNLPSEWYRHNEREAKFRFTYHNNQVYETTCSLKKA